MKIKIAPVWILIICAWSINLFLLLFHERGKDRIQISDVYVYKALEGRLHPWLLYADELDYYFIPSTWGDASCTYHRAPIKGFRTADVYVYVENLETEQYFGAVQSCVQHEVGHHIDRELDRLSDTVEFQKAVMTSIAMWKNLPEDGSIPGAVNVQFHWRFVGYMIANFPGINGNEKLYGEDEEGNQTGYGWGGFDELYADLHDIDYLIQIPPPLQVYFEDFIPYTWEKS